MISSHIILSHFIIFHMEITLRLWCSCLLSDLVKHDLTMVCTGSAGSAFDSSFSGGWCRNFPSRWHVSKCFISKPSKLFLQTLFHFATKKTWCHHTTLPMNLPEMKPKTRSSFLSRWWSLYCETFRHKEDERFALCLLCAWFILCLSYLHLHKVHYSTM